MIDFTPCHIHNCPNEGTVEHKVGKGEGLRREKVCAEHHKQLLAAERTSKYLLKARASAWYITDATQSWLDRKQAQKSVEVFVLPQKSEVR